MRKRTNVHSKYYLWCITWFVYQSEIHTDTYEKLKVTMMSFLIDSNWMVVYYKDDNGVIFIFGGNFYAQGKP
ncbi:hypothetical protein [Lysinibacillus fusiformis]